MKWLGVLLLALSGCLGDLDVKGALDGYCAHDEAKVCAADAECCPGFSCVVGRCHAVCANPDAGCP